MTEAPRVAGLLLVALLAGSCDTFFFLRGTLGGDCDPPRETMTDLGTDTATLRRSNCQPMGAVCCRTNARTNRTSCQYPEDCYVAPFHGACATPVDCADSQTCSSGSCQCLLGGPPCADPTTHVVTCCATGQLCDPVMSACTPASSAGAPPSDAGAPARSD